MCVGGGYRRVLSQHRGSLPRHAAPRERRRRRRAGSELVALFCKTTTEFGSIKVALVCPGRSAPAARGGSERVAGGDGPSVKTAGRRRVPRRKPWPRAYLKSKNRERQKVGAGKGNKRRGGSSCLPFSSQQSPGGGLQPTVRGGRSALVLLLAVVRFVPLVHGVFWRLHPLLLEELLELGQAHVGVLLLQAWQIDLFESREGGFHPALGVPVQIVGNAAGGETIQRERDTSETPPCRHPPLVPL